jgi:hypothetical protein
MQFPSILYFVTKYKYTYYLLGLVSLGINLEGLSDAGTSFYQEKCLESR